MAKGIILKTVQKLVVYGWKNYGPSNLKNISSKEANSILAKAAKAINQRMVRLEKKGITGFAYNLIMDFREEEEIAEILKGRLRFPEKASFYESLSPKLIREFLAEYRRFLDSSTSTVQGYKENIDNKYQSMVSEGFTGDVNEAMYLLNKYFDKATQELFMSEVIRDAIVSGHVDILDEVTILAKARGWSKETTALEYFERKYDKKTNKKE